MSDEATGKSGKTWLYVTGILALLPVLYVLSIGPMAVLFLRKAVPEEGFVVYRPLHWVAEKTDTSLALQTYMKSCCKLTGRVVLLTEPPQPVSSSLTRTLHWLVPW